MTQDSLTPEALVDILIPRHLRVSPLGDQVAYILSPASRKHAYPVSSVWVATIGVQNSARRLTTGDFHDSLVEWTLDGKNVTFLSDRESRGTSSAIFTLCMRRIRDPYSMFPPFLSQEILSYSWSPDGMHIAFLTQKETTSEDAKGDRDKIGAKVYGQNWIFPILRCLDPTTKRIRTLVSKNSYIKEFVWTKDSLKIIYALHETPEPDSAGYQGTKFETVNISTGQCFSVSNFPGPVEDFVCQGDRMLFRAGVSPSHASTSWMTYTLDLEDRKWSKYAYGVDSCAVQLRSTWFGSAATKVQSGLRDQIHLINRGIIYDGMHEIEGWDVIQRSTEDYIVVLAKSSGAAPTEIFSILGDSSIQLSQHNASIAAMNIGQVEPFYFTAEDGTSLDGIFVSPLEAHRNGAWPTVVIPHGGPYKRVSMAFDTPYYGFTPWLVSKGFAVLSPNYRGGSSHGEKHASAARGGMGTLDYSDLITAVRTGVSRGLVDEGRVAILGWSQGGYHAYLSVTREDFPFKGAICGAGVTDLDMLIMTSCHPWYEADLAGTVPWSLHTSDVSNRHRSPLWGIKHVAQRKGRGKGGPSILILHPEEDRTIPVSQALAFHRGCMLHGIQCELVIYPREDHIIVGRNHRRDMLIRILEFCRTCLN
jgi:dipeptidyl aminopeptidase/acylaminoacyl peptidase